MNREVTRLLNAVQKAAIDRRFDPNLLKAGVLDAKLRQIHAKVGRSGKHLLVRSELDFLSQEVSFGTFSSRQVRIVGHLPVSENKYRFKTNHLIPVPFPLHP